MVTSFGISWATAAGVVAVINAVAARSFPTVLKRTPGITSDLTFVEHPVIISRFAARLGFDVHTLEIRRDSNSRAGITDEIPSDEVLISAIEWIGKRPLDRVRPQ